MSGWKKWFGDKPDFEFDKEIEVDIDVDVDLDYDIDIDKEVDVDFDLNSDLHIDGNVTSFTLEAEALGDATFVEVDVVANSIEGQLSSLQMVGTVAADG